MLKVTTKPTEPTESERLYPLFKDTSPEVRLKALKTITSPKKIRAWAVLITALASAVGVTAYRSGIWP